MSQDFQKRFSIPAEKAMAVFVREAIRLDIGEADFRTFHESVVSSLGLRLDFRDFEVLHESCLSLKTDVCDLLAEVREGGTRLVALSNMPEYTWRLLGRRHAIADMFDDAVLSSTYSVVKPDPAIFEIALEREGVGRADALFVDDRLDNVTAAGNLGIRSLLFRTCKRLRDDLTAIGLL